MILFHIAQAAGQKMKENERKVLKTFNAKCHGDELIEAPYDYCRFDAYNSSHIMEIKCRNKLYDDTIIEFDKFAFNTAYASFKKKGFWYLVEMESTIYTFNPLKLSEENYDFKWEWRQMPRNTEFGNKEPIEKFVGYINVRDSFLEISY